MTEKDDSNGIEIEGEEEVDATLSINRDLRLQIAYTDGIPALELIGNCTYTEAMRLLKIGLIVAQEMAKESREISVNECDPGVKTSSSQPSLD